MLLLMMVLLLMVLFGTIIMRFSALRITVWRKVISVTVPVTTESISIKSPILNGLPMTMNIPPTKLDSASCDARPMAMARIPALASMEVPICLSAGMSERIDATPMM